MPIDTSRARSLLREMYRHRVYYLVILPAIVCFVVAKHIPIGGIVLAFKNYTITGGIWGSEWAGLKYFERMLGSADFLRVFRNTIVVSLLKMATVFPAPIVFALMLNEVFNLRLKKTLQTISYLPHFISWVVAAGLFRSFLSFEGPVNYLLELFTDQRVVFMKDPFFFMMVVVTPGVWKTVGWGSIIYLAAIAGIDPELDGAGIFTLLARIIVPLSLPVIATGGLWSVVYHWNEWFDAMIYAARRAMIVLQLLLRRILIEKQAAEWLELASEETAVTALTEDTVKAAILFLSIRPIIIAYPFIQRYFAKGIMMGSLKE